MDKVSKQMPLYQYTVTQKFTWTGAVANKPNRNVKEKII